VDLSLPIHLQETEQWKQNFTHFLRISRTVAIKISRNPFQNYSNLSNYQNADFTPIEKLQKNETEGINIRINSPRVEISPEIPPKAEKDTADVAHPNPTPEGPPKSIQSLDSSQKSSLDSVPLGKFGTHEFNLVVFAAFSWGIQLDMGINKFLATGTYYYEKNLPFSIVYGLGAYSARVCFVAALVVLISRLKFKIKAPKWMPKTISEGLLSQDVLSTIQECLLYYNAGASAIASQYGEIGPVGDKLYMIWPTFI
jgi:hypothetical protein